MVLSEAQSDSPEARKPKFLLASGKLSQSNSPSKVWEEARPAEPTCMTSRNNMNSQN